MDPIHRLFALLEIYSLTGRIVPISTELLLIIRVDFLRDWLVEFREITWDNFIECIELQVKEEQKCFISFKLWSF